MSEAGVCKKEKGLGRGRGKKESVIKGTSRTIVLTYRFGHAFFFLSFLLQMFGADLSKFVCYVPDWLCDGGLSIARNVNENHNAPRGARAKNKEQSINEHLTLVLPT